MKRPLINQPFDWSYYISINARDKAILLRRLSSLFVDFEYKKWIRDHNVVVIDSTVVITFSGRTISDHVPIVYPNMVWDKVVVLLEELVDKRHIINYTFHSKIDNIISAKATIKKSKQSY